MKSADFYSQHTKVTRSLKKFIGDYELELAPEIFEAFLDQLSAELVSASAQLQGVPRGAERARFLHARVEEETTQGDHIAVSCKKGCSACCHMEVEVTTYEAEILKNLVVEGYPINRERLVAQSQRELQDKAWFQGRRHRDNPCVFLNQAEGACGIYADRPVMCRRHSVSSPAENCETLDAKIAVRYFPKVDLWISAANEDPEVQVGPLAKMLEVQLQK